MTDDGKWRTTEHDARVAMLSMTAGLLLVLGLLFAFMGAWEDIWILLLGVPAVCFGAYLWMWWDLSRVWHMVSKDYEMGLDRVSGGITRALTDRGVGFSRGDVKRIKTTTMAGKLEEMLTLEAGGLEIRVYRLGYLRVFIGPITEYNRNEVNALSRIVDEALAEG